MRIFSHAPPTKAISNPLPLILHSRVLDTSTSNLLQWRDLISSSKTLGRPQSLCDGACFSMSCFDSQLIWPRHPLPQNAQKQHLRKKRLEATPSIQDLRRLDSSFTRSRERIRMGYDKERLTIGPASLREERAKERNSHQAKGGLSSDNEISWF